MNVLPNLGGLKRITCDMFATFVRHSAAGGSYYRHSSLTFIPSGELAKLRKLVLLWASQELLTSRMGTPFASRTVIFLGPAGSRMRITLVVLTGLLTMKEYL